MKISVIMPTFNDKDSICETIDSLLSQTYHNWELIIIDDGSTDGTEEIIERYKNQYDKSNQIQYYYQENTDQLKAIIKGLDYINGDYVFILHSDDLLAAPSVFENCINYFKNNKDVDSLIADLVIIDEHSNIKGFQPTLPYYKKKKIPPMQLLWLGRNLYVDVAFHKRDVFINKVKENYLLWNMPFWLCINNNVNMLNVHKVNFPLIKYRVHSGNYINNEIGKLNVLNGELRTATNLMRYYDIPYYKLQYFVYRLFNKLNLLKFYYPIYINRETIDKSSIIEFIIEKRYGNYYKNNLFLNNLVKFYNNKKSRVITINDIPNDEAIYYGNMMRLFNKNLIDNHLSEFYINLLEEMGEGFTKIVTNSDENKNKLAIITKFLCIDKFITIDVIEETKRK